MVYILLTSLTVTTVDICVLAFGDVKGDCVIGVDIRLEISAFWEAEDWLSCKTLALARAAWSVGFREEKLIEDIDNF